MVGRPAPAAERFWAKVQITPGCWLWLAGISKQTGYAKFWDGERDTTAHRFSWQLHNGPIPEGLEIDHVWPRCSGGVCPNPDHLEAVTQKINKKRQGATISRCRQGHDYTPENTRYDTKGWRRCRECERQHARDYYQRSKQNV
jgi:hypothetical protein